MASRHPRQPPGRGAPGPQRLTQLAGRALADRDYATAADRYGQAQAQAPQDPYVLYLRLYALCMLGELAELATPGTRATQLVQSGCASFPRAARTLPQ